MKYRNLDLSFSIEDIEFTILSICLEQLVKPIPMHSHGKDSYEIHYVSYGYGTLHLSETSYEIVPGTLFITGPQVEHEQISNPAIPMTECLYEGQALCQSHAGRQFTHFGFFAAFFLVWFLRQFYP